MRAVICLVAVVIGVGEARGGTVSIGGSISAQVDSSHSAVFGYFDNMLHAPNLVSLDVNPAVITSANADEFGFDWGDFEQRIGGRFNLNHAVDTFTCEPGADEASCTVEFELLQMDATDAILWFFTDVSGWWTLAGNASGHLDDGAQELPWIADPRPFVLDHITITYLPAPVDSSASWLIEGRFVPEPSSAALLLVGLAAVATLPRKRRQHP